MSFHKEPVPPCGTAFRGITMKDHDRRMDSSHFRGGALCGHCGAASPHHCRRLLRPPSSGHATQTYLACSDCLLFHLRRRARAYLVDSQPFGPFHDIHMGGRHIHHLVFGIVILLLVGYGWMVDACEESKGWRLGMRRLLSILYGSAAALTLDEFALWLNLRDVYWAREGRSSLDAAVLFAAFLIIGIVGGPLWKGLVHEFGKQRQQTR